MQFENQTWCNQDEIELFKKPRPESEPRKYLVYAAESSDPSCLTTVPSAKPRCFDIAARYHVKPHPDDRLPERADYVLTGGLSKFDSAKKFITKCDLADKYDGFVFIDGDVEFEPGGIDRLLRFASAMQFDLAQAALTSNSYSSWPVTFASRTFVCRETSFVEVMAPYFSRAALREVLPTFSESISSYGLDFAWPTLLKGSRIGIVDAIKMRHSKRIDVADGTFYRYLHSIGVDPAAKQSEILRKYGVSVRERPHDIAGYRVADEADRQTLIRVPLLQMPRALARYMRIQDQAAIRFARIFRTSTTVRLQDPLP